jgi:D-tyrosyl-tRNA(Tyr) deacylase
MRALVQRVSQARVSIEGSAVGEIGVGLLVFLGVSNTDSTSVTEKLARRVLSLRIFPDAAGKMNQSVRDISGELLIVSQFTLYANTSRGNRPSFMNAAAPELAEQLYKLFLEICATSCRRVEAGKFQAHMEVSLINDGPVTIMLDSAVGGT